MRAYHGGDWRNRKGYFEGWYFKHRTGREVFAAIPGMAADERGRRTAFIQVISGEGASFHPFPFDQFRASERRLCVEIGPNRFSEAGVSLDLPGLRAELRYGAPVRLEGGDIMGPFRYVPFMECRHGVISLNHNVDGYVEAGGARRSFDGGSGYIEKDWGRSFPRSWTWLECHDFQGADGSVMVALADIPFLGAHFTGIIAVCRADGAQHRIATYRGAHIARQSDDGGRYALALRQGGYALEVEVAYGAGGALRAPCMGRMERTIVEYPDCAASVELRRGGKVLLRSGGAGASFERATF